MSETLQKVIIATMKAERRRAAEAAACAGVPDADLVLGALAAARADAERLAAVVRVCKRAIDTGMGIIPAVSDCDRALAAHDKLVKEVKT